MTAVELVIKEIDQQQKRYIDLAKKDKSIKKEVDAILTATTFLKMKCEQVKEMDNQQKDDYAIEFVEWKDNYCFEVMGSNSLLFYIRDNEKFDDVYNNRELLKIFKNK